MRFVARSSTVRLALCFALAAMPGCDNDPTEASIVNEVPGATIRKTWFRTTLFTDSLETGQTSRTLRIGVGAEHAFAIVRINERAFLARTNEPIDAGEGETTRIVFSPTTARSLCFGEPRLSADEQADLAARIFPGDELAMTQEDCGAR
jgi:hypothetical protein